jgi:hypothetical protein
MEDKKPMDNNLPGKSKDFIEKKVGVVLFDPLEKKPLVEDLMRGYIEDLQTASGQQVSYQLVSTIVANIFPPLLLGQRYTKEEYRAALEDNKKAYQIVPGQFLMADYEVILQDFRLKDQLNAKKINEVWLWGGGYFGFWESILGGWGAFPCNSSYVIPHSSFSPRFAVMGFNYDRQVGEMLESFGHRVESTLARKFGSQDFLGSLYDQRRIHSELLKPRNDFEKFLLEQGTVHRVPDAPKTPPGENDYYWNPNDIRTHHQKWLGNMKPEWWKVVVNL